MGYVCVWTLFLENEVCSYFSKKNNVQVFYMKDVYTIELYPLVKDESCVFQSLNITF